MNSITKKTRHVLRSSWVKVNPLLPGFVQRKIIERRHIKIVTTNIRDLIPLGFTQPQSGIVCNWSNPQITITGPTAGLNLESLTDTQAIEVQEWLDSQPFDSDEHLDMRMDGFHDEVGRTIAALNTRLRLRTITTQGAPPPRGNRILFDARSLQTSVISGRGIGRFAAAALNVLLENSQESGSITLLVDNGKPLLPNEIWRSLPSIAHVTQDNAADFSLFIQPSPMTAPVNQFEELLGRDIKKVALIYDFIPADFPGVYLTKYAQRAEYCAALDSLSLYTDFVCISHLTKQKLIEYGVNPLVAERAVVAWPRNVVGAAHVSAPDSVALSNRIVVMSGDEPRKNTVGALGAAGAVTSSELQRNIVVIGMPRHQNLVHHLSMYAAIRPGEVVAQTHLSDRELAELISGSGVALVLSFDEGLSLPVIEALRCGTPVVASDIPAHRELIGSGPYLANPHSIPDMVRAIHFARNNRALAAQQYQRLLQHQHEDLELVVQHHCESRASTASQPVEREPATARSASSGKLSVGVATPWFPQASGVADFSTTIFTQMADQVELTLYATESALAHLAENKPAGVTVRGVSELLAANARHEHDELIAVIGNSHFHLPFVELLSLTECTVVSHDTRMVEFYMALRGKGGAEEVMVTTLEPGAQSLNPQLDDQIDDMRLLQNLGLWEVARRGKRFVTHSITCKDVIREQTGTQPFVLPFANQRVPQGDITESRRREARQRLGFSDNCLHLVSFGYVDVRTKLNDVLIASAAWLSHWGHKVNLTFAGGASEFVTAELNEQAEEMGVTGLTVTGFLEEHRYQDYLLAADIGLQLRVSDFLGVSGPLSDLSAFGTTSIASEGLARDTNAPSYVHRVPSWISALQLAQEIERVHEAPVDPAEREQSRLVYLKQMSPGNYVDQLLGILSS